MRKNRMMGAALGIVMAASVASSAFAAWAPSKTQEEIISASGSATIGGSKTSITTVIGGKKVPDGYPLTSTGNMILSQVSDPVILVTPLSLTQLGNQGVGEGLAYKDKAGLETESGLTYGTNAKTNLVYQTVINAQDTSEFLSKFPGDVQGSMEALIAQKIEAKRTELEQQKAEAEANGDEETVAAIEKQLAALEKADYASVDNYSPLAVFDVSASAALLEQMQEGDTVDVTFELNGVNQNSDLIALHFMGNIEDCDAAMDMVNNDFVNATLDFQVEVLDVATEDGKATITLSSFSPVMLMTRIETEEGAQPSQEPQATQQPEEKPQPEESGNILPWVIGGAVVVIAVILFVVAKTKKKTPVEK